MTASGREWRLDPANLVLFGPPGVGKSSVGRALAAHLDRHFVDLDERVAAAAGKSVEAIFREEGEQAFRRHERRAALQAARGAGQVVACGGGALLEDEVRQAMEATGTVICLRASEEQLRGRLPDGPVRPLLAGSGSPGLAELLRARRSVYDRFAIQVRTDGLALNDVVELTAEAARTVERFELRVSQDAGYSVHFERGLLQRADQLLGQGEPTGPRAVVCDRRVARPWGEQLSDALDAPLLRLPQGEQAKRLDVIEGLAGGLLEAGLDRRGVVIAVGGGAALDAAGFAAAGFMRGVRWIAVPTTLLAAVDASVGGKVGVDLPPGKNLFGAFHPPFAVWTDPRTLDTLPAVEWRNGMAEVVKAALIGDAELFGWIEGGFEGPTDRWVRRALEVKRAIVEADPQERGGRARLNLGHTVGHALEAASGFRLPHGEAVAIGTVAEARVSAALGRAEPELVGRIERALRRFDLPVRPPRLDIERVLGAIRSDKKARWGKAQFSLPVEIGRVDIDVEVPETLVREVLEDMRPPR